MNADISPLEVAPRPRTALNGDDFLKALSTSLVDASRAQDMEQILESLAKTLHVDHVVLAKPPRNAQEPLRILRTSVGSATLVSLCEPIIRVALEQVVNRGYACCPAKAASQLKEGADPGPVKIESFMGVPLFDRDTKLIGALLILDRKVLGYTNFLRGVLAMFASRLSAELELEEQLRLARSAPSPAASAPRNELDAGGEDSGPIPQDVRLADMLDLKARFEELCEEFACLAEKPARLSQEDFWESALGRMAQCAEASRAYLVRLEPETLAVERVYQCAVDDAPAADEAYFAAVYASPESEGWKARLASGHALDIPVVSELGNAMARERNILVAAGVKSFFGLPLREGRKTIGFFALEYLDCHERRLSQVQFHFRLLGKVLTKMLLCKSGVTPIQDGLLGMAEAGRLTPRITPTLISPKDGRIHLPKKEESAATASTEFSKTGMPTLDSLLEHVEAFVYVVGITGQILFASPGCQRLLGRHEEEVVGHGFMELLHPKDVAKHQRSIARALAKGEGEQAAEYRLRHKNGSFQHHLVNTHVVRDPMGGFLYIVGVAQDITLYKRTEQRLLEFKDNAQHANRAKDRFLAHMDHELRTHLQPILGYAELLKGAANLTDRQKDDLSVVLESSRHIAEMLQAFNDAVGTTLDSGKAGAKIDLPRVLDRVIRHFETSARAKGLTLQVERGNNLPAELPGNERQLEGVLRNLLENAVNYTETGEIGLSVRPEEDGGLSFEVRDTGEGIFNDEQDSVFEPFYQGVAGRRANRGMGLGLSISRNLVSQLGGHLNLESQPEVGSRFWFKLDAPQPDLVPPPPMMNGQGTPRHAAPQHFEVLVAEPSAHTRRLLRDILEPLGLIVHECGTGSEALHLARSLQPSAILMDLRLAGSNGAEVARLLRNLAGDRLKCLVAISDSAFRKLGPIGTKTGWNAQFVKPLDRQALLEVLAQQLNADWLLQDTAVLAN